MSFRKSWIAFAPVVVLSFAVLGYNAIPPAQPAAGALALAVFVLELDGWHNTARGLPRAGTSPGAGTVADEPHEFHH